MEEKHYQIGFNQGYLLQRHNPELAAKLKEAIKDSGKDRDLGFLDGIKEYKIEELDKDLEKDQGYPIPPQHHKAPDHSKDKDADMDLERD